MADTPPVPPVSEPPPKESPRPAEEPKKCLDKRFLEAWLNRADHRVAGIRLRPYCFQSALVLQQLESPFVSTEDKPITWADVFRAAAVCRTRFEQLPRFPSNFRMVLYATTSRFLWWLTKGRLGTTLSQEAAAFRAYQNDFESTPDLFFENEGRELTAPVILARCVYLQRVCHLPEERVWTMPIGKALWIYAAALEQEQPGVSLLEEEDAEVMQLIRRLQAGEIPLPPDLQPDALNAKGAPSRLTSDLFGPA